jgi:CO/xanthine dehydrogenase Mo-binding subunit
MLYGKIKRSSHPHAKILNIDTSKAEALPGVKAILTSKNVPDAKYGYGFNDESLIARDKVRYVGDPVAAVAAISEDIAEEAIELIEIEYEVLPAVFDPEEAFKPDCAVIIHEDLSSYELTFFPPAKMEIERPNVCNHFKIRRGDEKDGFLEADGIVEDRFETPAIQHCPLEPHVSIADVDPEGKVAIWSSSQQPFLLTTQLSGLLKIPPSKLRVIVPYVGGGFGNKTQCKTEAINILLSKMTKRPIKTTLTREEVFKGTTVRGGAVTYIKIGAKKDGTLTAMDIKIIYDTGGYSADGFVTMTRGPFQAVGTYKVPNLKLDSYLVYTNKPIGGAFRGFGNTELNWAIESALDMLAEQIGMDPAELRAKNLLKEGDENAFGEIMHSVGTEECLQKVVKTLDWNSKKEKNHGVWKRGRGLACGNKYSIAPSASCATVKVHSDGVIEVRTSAIEIGQGCQTVLAQIAAEEFKVPLSKVKMISTDTDITPFDFGTVSSRVTYHDGNAIILACRDAKNQIYQLAAKKLGVSPLDLTTENGKVFVKGSPLKSLALSELYMGTKGMGHIGKFLEKEGELLGKATFYSKMGAMNPETSQLLNKNTRSCSFWTEQTQGAEVEVNTETGQIRIIKYVSAVDAGRAINPIAVEGQIEGGIVMGIGSTLYEEMTTMENGWLANPGFTDYKLPQALDLPDLENMKAIIVEAPHKDGPYGAKGMGEGVLVCTAPAIANAIYDATGVRIKEIPITAEKMFKALKEKK